MTAGSLFRSFFGRLVIAGVHYPWRIAEKSLRRRFPVKEHYVIMKIFRAMADRFPVTISYPNPIAVDAASMTLALDLCENSQQWYFRMRERYELEWVKLIGLAMTRAESFVDAGSNVGVFAIAVAKAFPQSRVVAIEPLPANYSKLQENIRLNDLSNIEPIRAAVTDGHGPISFYVNPIHDGGGSVIGSVEYQTGDVRIAAATYQQKHPSFVPVVAVEGLRLDDIITRSSVLKLDVEGAEVSALRSASSALKGGLVDVMVVEVTNDSADEVIGFLDGVGFDCFDHGQATPLTRGFRFRTHAGNIMCLRRQSDIRRLIKSGGNWLTGSV